jgi:hypothetical protein
MEVRLQARGLAVVTALACNCCVRSRPQPQRHGPPADCSRNQLNASSSARSIWPTPFDDVLDHMIRHGVSESSQSRSLRERKRSYFSAWSPSTRGEQHKDGNENLINPRYRIHRRCSCAAFVGRELRAKSLVSFRYLKKYL